jgi:Omp85 superfamily domain
MTCAAGGERHCDALPRSLSGLCCTPSPEIPGTNRWDVVMRVIPSARMVWLLFGGSPLAGSLRLPSQSLTGLLVLLSMVFPPNGSGQMEKRYQAPSGSVTEFLPFASYDTDAGFGLGVKIFALNHFRSMESFDGILFWSSKGERWVRLVFSIMDFELRQGTEYPLAFDLTADYDKWINYKFFGVGNTSSYDSKETYTREPLELNAQVSRGFTTTLVGSAGLRYRMITNVDVSPAGQLAVLPPAENQGRATSLGVRFSLRYDSRNSTIHPSAGLVLLAEGEAAPRSFGGNVGYGRYLGMVSWYRMGPLFKTVLAARLSLEGVSGENLPIQMLTAIGGTRSLRGYVQDRFIDRIAAIANLELRFPLFWRLGGILGFDAGKVWHTPDELDLARWPCNPVAGLRLYMDTFVARADVGFGKETTGFYLNFGHLF